MKQFLYLDNDIVNSIIAQTEKGIIVQQTREHQKGEDNSSQDNMSVEGKMKGGASFLKFMNASAELGASHSTSDQNVFHSSRREVEEKILHDAAFDVSLKYLDSIVKEPNDSLTEGDYIMLKRRFDCVDFDYLEGLFVKDGIVDLIKKQEIEAIQRNAPAQHLAKQSKGDGYKNAKANDAIKEKDKEYKDIQSAIKALRGFIPYKRMLYSNDGFLIPLDDKYFRIDHTNLGFKYGGEMTCLGMVTNIIDENVSPATSSVFGTLQIAANKGLKGILSSKSETVCVIHPIAVYYGR